MFRANLENGTTVCIRWKHVNPTEMKKIGSNEVCGTTCTISKDGVDTVIYTGATILSQSDNFSRPLGRRLSLVKAMYKKSRKTGNMEAKEGFSKKDRELIWNTFLKQWPPVIK